MQSRTSHISLRSFELCVVLFLISTQSWADCVSGNCVNGQGTYTYADGGKYVGEWRDDKRNGQGTNPQEKLVGRGVTALKCRMLESMLNPSSEMKEIASSDRFSFAGIQAAYAFMTAFNLHLDAQYRRDLGADSTDVLKAYVKDQCEKHPSKWAYEIIISYFERLPQINN